MKRRSHLFDQIVSWQNLLQAAKRARRGKQGRPDVAAYEFRREWELLALRRHLIDETYRPGVYRSFSIFEPKERLISAAPYRDRVVHHAICGVLEPLIDRTFIDDSYACRRGKGTHAAVRKAKRFAQSYRYVLQADIQKFFPTIDHDILLDTVCRKVKDKKVLRLLERIIRHPYPGQQRPSLFPGDDLFTFSEGSCGLPIGNQTSQFLANVMLDPLDQWIKRRLSIGPYVRYADDLLVFSDDKAKLWALRERIRQFLARCRLRLHDRKSTIFPARCGIPFLGYRIYPTHIRLSKTNVKRFRRRMREFQFAYASGTMSIEEARQSIMAWWGHAQHADAWNLARGILRQHAFCKSCGASAG